MPLWRREAAAPEGPPPLRADQVHAVFTTLLDREPSEQETRHHLATLVSLEELLRVVRASAEFRATAPPRPAAPDVANIWHPELADLGHPVGTTSDDGVAQVGRDGWLFLVGGTNAVLGQHQGEAALPAGWLASWREAQRIRLEGSRALGAPLVGVVVPDKLAVLRAHLPHDLPDDAAPAVALARDAEVAVEYPVAELAAVAEGAFLRTDTHLTFAGNRALADLVCDRFAVEPHARPPAPELSAYVSSGDLGNRLLPHVVERMVSAQGWGRASVLDDNHDRVNAVGGHIGTRRILGNHIALDPRTVVVFGDSYSFPAPHYQGVAWHLAQVFREVHFLWIPYGWDPTYCREVGADAVLCETAERFVVRPPAPQVDVRALAAQTLAKGRGITLDEAG